MAEVLRDNWFPWILIVCHLAGIAIWYLTAPYVLGGWWKLTWDRYLVDGRTAVELYTTTRANSWSWSELIIHRLVFAPAAIGFALQTLLFFCILALDL